MRRKLLLPALLACSMLAISAPVVSAKSHAHSASLASSLSKISGAVKGLQKAVGNIVKVNLGQTGAIHGVDTRVDTVVANVAAVKATVDAIVAGVPAIVDGLTQLKAGLLAIQSALGNTTTGLVGLNLARPQFGNFSGAGVILGGTGQVTGASGPKTDATHPATGTYVVDFGNDVSKRSLVVSPSPGVGGIIGEAVDCANAGGTCPGGDASANHVLVLMYATSGAPSNGNGFGVTAISG
jgi:hypothetical protein